MVTLFVKKSTEMLPFWNEKIKFEFGFIFIVVIIVLTNLYSGLAIRKKIKWQHQFLGMKSSLAKS
jgi:hypothetical protein